MRPFDVERGLSGPGEAIRARMASEPRHCADRLIDPEAGWRGQPESSVEGTEVGRDRRRAERVDDHDRAAATVDSAREQPAHVVCRVQLSGPIAAASQAKDALLSVRRTWRARLRD